MWYYPVSYTHLVRLDHEIGSIAVGKKADLLLLTEDLELDSVYIDGNKII